MDWVETSFEQQRQLIDTSQAFMTWRAAHLEQAHSYGAVMRWKQSKGQSYLYRVTTRDLHKVEKSLGRRSEETETLFEAHRHGRSRVKSRIKKSAAVLDQMARINKAMRLQRVPPMETKLLRSLDKEGLLGTLLVVVGTNALYAYEMRAGVHIASNTLATKDLDLLWDERRRISLAITSDVPMRGILGVLKDVDKTFQPTSPRSFRAANDDGFLVDLIYPFEPDIRKKRPQKIGRADDELYAVGIHGLDWLVNSPKFDETVIGFDGWPLRLPCIDPRAFALHKLWLSTRPDRDPKKRPRDAAQATCVAALCERMNLPFDAKQLKALPLELRTMKVLSSLRTISAP
jgi:hypothetical protein